MLWSIASVVAGVLLIAVAVIDVFQTLLRPRSTGTLSHFLFRGWWRLVHRSARARAVSGPAMILVVIAVWVIMTTLGWALIYLPVVPDGFVYSGVEPGRHHPFVEAITISLVTLTTLGYGDAVANVQPLRLVSPLEALTGFALLTASVSWFMQLYPALARRRALAVQLTSLHEVGAERDLNDLDPRHAATIVSGVSLGISALIADVTQNAELFYFSDQDEQFSMPRAMSYAVGLRDAALACDAPDVRLEGRVLETAIDRFAEVLQAQYPHVAGRSSDEILARVADSHGVRFGTGDPGEPAT